ncbi:4-phosphoerythronate dehydrogenase [Congregibacter brevis]|uniref:4-phosphoerythronate dehydrogenase n=1 Tax=Congregibacter brevis TaxID=3081201 RepID=A0ABZ0IBS0_9GAMM|nr:4-phosphoerythronate dehydrogenase [Congregibacter sp. IMCC45268]
MIRVLADQNMVGLDLLPSEGLEIRTLPGRSISAADLEEVDALWVRSITPVTQELVQKSQLRFVGTATAGVEHVDQDALAANGIRFAAAPGANANSVVEYVLAALAELQEPWERLEAGDALGIVGHGHVGRLLAQVAGDLGWHVKVYDPWLAAEDAEVDWASLQDILDCRVISLHCSLHQQSPWPSYHLIDAEALAALDNRQWLINAARGAVIDNRALLKHLQSESPVNCVLDVWEGEPECDWSLLAMPSLKLASAHIAGYSWEAKWNATKMLYEHLRKMQLVETPIQIDENTVADLAPVQETGCSAARELIQQRYTIAEDNLLFRNLAKLPAAERAAGFDALRREYRKREELRGTRLPFVGGDASPPLRRMARALGVALA